MKGGFGKLWVLLTFTLAWKELTGAEHRVLDVIVSKSDGRTGLSNPRESYIAARIGRAERTVRRALRRLERLRLIVLVSPGGGRESPNTYKVADPIADELDMEPGFAVDANGDPIYPDTRMSGFVARNPDTGAPIPGHSEHNTRTPARRNPDTRMSARIQKSENQKQKKPTAAIFEKRISQRPDPEILRMLDRAGIEEPWRSNLAQAPGITVEIVSEATEECRRRGKGPPIIREKIEADIRRKAAEGEDSERTATARQNAKRLAVSEDREIQETDNLAIEWINGSEKPSDVELVELYDRMIVEDSECVPLLLRPKTGDLSAKAAHIRKNLATEIYRFANPGNANKPGGACERE